tara:strand:- start:9 stop:215 length:207 start_codon:yes stop_codon:yes gene_type:complete
LESKQDEKNSLAWALDDCSDEDVLADDFMEGTIAKDEREDQLIMCCCQQDQKHDESMKFQIKVNEKYE